MKPRGFLRLLVLLPALLLVTAPGQARDAPALSADPALESRMMSLATELRCLVCQNQTIADSQSGLAIDLRQQIRELLARGLSDDQVREHMTQRYGDFVLYRPPFKPSTALLWAGPPLLLVAALGGLLLTLRRRLRAGPDAFEPDSGLDPDPGPGPATDRGGAGGNRFHDGPTPSAGR